MLAVRTLARFGQRVGLPHGGLWRKLELFFSVSCLGYVDDVGSSILLRRLFLEAPSADALLPKQVNNANSYTTVIREIGNGRT